MIDLSETVKSNKANQLNFDDLDGPMILRVTKVEKVKSDDQPTIIHFEGDDGKPFKPCLSMRRVLFGAWGKDGSDYVGRSIKIYGDPTVKNMGEIVGGIRISHLSDIDGTKSILLTVTRGKRSPYIVKKLEVSAPKPEKTIEEMRVDCIEALSKKGFEVPADQIGEAQTKEELTAIYKEAIK